MNHFHILHTLLLAALLACKCMCSPSMPLDEPGGCTIDTASRKASEEDAADAVDPSFLQQGYAVSKRGIMVASPSEVHSFADAMGQDYEGFALVGAQSRLPAANETVEQWLSKTKRLGFTPALWIVFLVLIALTVLHEIYVYCGGFPLLAHKDPSKSLAIQVNTVLMWIFFFSMMALTIPVSLDFAIACGIPPWLSAVFLAPFFPLTFIAMAVWFGSGPWNQDLARKCMIWPALLCGDVTAGWILVVMASDSWSTDQRRWIWILNQLASAQFMSVTMGVVIFPMISLQNMVCPVETKTFWALCQNVGKNMGFICGPMIFSLMQVLMGNVDGKLNPVDNFAWMGQVGGVITVIIALGNSLVYARSLAPEGAEEQQTAPAVEEEVAPPSPFDHLAPEVRVTMLWKILKYMMEREITASGVEVATVMLLETQYHWPVSWTGAGFAGVAFGGCICALLAAFFLKEEWEGAVFLFCATLSMFGCISFYNIPGTGFGFLLFGDFIVYGASTVAMGIADGWSMHASMPNTSYTYEWYRGWDMFRDQFSRITGPIVARAFLQYDKRNGYAVFQTVITALGLWTSISLYRTMQTDSKKAKETKETSAMGRLLVPSG